MGKGKKRKQSLQVKSSLLAIAIALVSVFFVVYAIQSFYPEPKYEDYCSMKPVKIGINNSADCEEIGGQWQSYGDADGGWCDVDFYCRQEYEPAREVYERNIFFVNLFIGLGVLLLGFFIDKKAVGSGLMAGGVIMMFYGTIRHWSDLSDVLRTIVLGITLTILILLAHKKLKD